MGSRPWWHNLECGHTVAVMKDGTVRSRVRGCEVCKNYQPSNKEKTDG